MAKKLPPTDVVIVGLGWTGAILAQQLCATGLRVVAIERGPWRDTATDFPDHLCPGRAALPRCATICSCAPRNRP